MKYRKGIKISEATEKELLRYQMEKIAKESCSEDLSGESTALAELYKSLKNSDIRVFICKSQIFQTSPRNSFLTSTMRSTIK